MKAVVDTNVIVYYLLETAGFSAAAESFWIRATEVMAPTLWEAELANAIGTTARHGALPAERVPDKLQQAIRLGIHSVPVRTLWQGAVLRSLSSGLAVYDSLFVELADREQVPLFTFDRKICRAFPKIARMPAA